MGQIDLLINLFPRIHSFAIQIRHNNTLELTVLHILKTIKRNSMPNITTCCLLTDNAPNDKIEKLKKMINSENLLKNYIMYRQREKFYLEWK
jgi:hypothetical protein